MVTEVVLLNESMQYMRALINEIGISMKSNAVCTNLQRISDGIFTLSESLLPHQINSNSVISAIEWSDQQLLQNKDSPIMRRRRHYSMQKTIPPKENHSTSEQLIEGESSRKLDENLFGEDLKSW